jgi:hypothetical protein
MMKKLPIMAAAALLLLATSATSFAQVVIEDGWGPRYGYYDYGYSDRSAVRPMPYSPKSSDHW